MVFEPESDDLVRDVEASMRMFEKSQVGPAAAITPIKPARILLVLDGSTQDDNGADAASYLRDVFNVETLVLDATQGGEAELENLAITRSATISGARPIERKPGDAYAAILAALDDHAVDLVIVPCPFGRSFERIGADSAGTVIDVLLTRCPKPMLVIRRDDQRLRDCVGMVSMLVGGECDVESRAAGWVFGLADDGGTVTLNLVIEKEQFENFRSLIETLRPEASFDSDQFSDALAKTHQSLHAAMAKTAAARGLSYQLIPQAGEVAPPNPLSASNKQLLVMPLEVDDRFGQGFVQDRIRRSPHPVLVVPGHVPQ